MIIAYILYAAQGTSFCGSLQLRQTFVSDFQEIYNIVIERLKEIINGNQL